MAHTDATLPTCFRQDLSMPAMIFGGLLITAAAVCGTMDMVRPSTPMMEEVRVLNDEHVIGPAGFDPYALDCKADKSGVRNHATLAASAGKENRCARRSAPSAVQLVNLAH